MEAKNQIVLDALKYIDPAMCSYQDWINVGMALKTEGHTAADWERWSSSDTARYHAGECFTKWMSFNEEASKLVTGATIVQMAKENGFLSNDGKSEDRGEALNFDSIIGGNGTDYKVVQQEWLEKMPVKEPVNWNQKDQILQYLNALFEADDHVSYVTEVWQTQDGRYAPSKGSSSRTARELTEALAGAKEIEDVFGDYKLEAGAWIRFNPVDGHGVKNQNVTDFRYALVESDTQDLATQNAILHELQLPIAALVYSGGKSVHAIVKIDAPTYEEYRRRVDYLYKICKKNGLDIDKQNRNPSRLSRFPGFYRKDKEGNVHKQFLMETNIGQASWEDWVDYIESVNDDLPDPDSLAAVWDNMPELAPPLIDGIMRCGHKMLISGPSKAGKSFALIELCIALAEGSHWLGWKCRQGRVMYVNLELDKASCFDRFKKVYEALDIPPDNLSNIDIWNLRGKSQPMDKLAPRLIRRAQKKDYEAIIIDPIYKVITGDENSADQMSKFCNNFDKIATELGCAVIYCHHHSKGAQGGKRAMDRASGSGVFARDPDALIDLLELEIDDQLQKEIGEYITGWQVDCTLREFRQPPIKKVFFEYPIHKIDYWGKLKNAQPEIELTPYEKKEKKRKEAAKEERNKKTLDFQVAFEKLMTEKGKVTVNDIAEEMGYESRTVNGWLGNNSRQSRIIKALTDMYEVCNETDENGKQLPTEIRLKEK